MKKALILWGGWEGHTPKKTTRILADELEANGFDIRLENSLKTLEKPEVLRELDLIVPFYTMGEISSKQWEGISKAVCEGIGLAGVHGGLSDVTSSSAEYYWMVGGRFVGHPYIGEYTVRLTNVKSPITEGMKPQFRYDSEQYYMLVDPANTVLAETTYDYKEYKCTMPVVWTKTWGAGRVFYSALGHVADEFRKYPDVLAMTVRGMLWASESARTGHFER
ncbi:MAG: ThuA domain-containing protein [Planctomycetota bacterium]